jgi:hypothetical protein
MAYRLSTKHVMIKKHERTSLHFGKKEIIQLTTPEYKEISSCLVRMNVRIQVAVLTVSYFRSLIIL